MKAALLSPAPAVAWLLITLLVSLSGPFGTYAGLPLLRRVLYWGAVVAVSIVCGVSMRVLVQRWLPDRGYWVWSMVTALAMALLLAVPLTLFTGYMSQGTENRVPSVAEMAFLVFVVGTGIAALRSLLAGHGKPAGPEPRLLRRLAPGQRGRLIRIEVSDHYVVVHTEMGEARLLMRFSDALAELDGIEGLQVHRSHWVAADAVRKTVCDKGRTFLSLTDGSLVPVSRNYREAVRERLGL